MSADQVVVVTGGGRGIGRAVCVRYARDGARIVALARSLSELGQTQAAVAEAGGQCHVLSVDLKDPVATNRAIREVVRQFGRIDILVNSAGVAPLRSVEDLSEDVFDEIWAVNVKAIYVTCRAAWEELKKSQGVIVNISSVASENAFSGFAAYGASKAWVNAWTRGLAEEGRSARIRVFSIAPGGVETGMLRGVFPDYPKGETLDPADVADMVYAVARPECRYATGQTIFVQRHGD